MNLPVNLPLSDSPAVITSYTEASDGTTTWAYVSYYHVPLFYQLTLVFLLLLLFSRLLTEFLIRLRRRTHDRKSLIA